MEDEGGVPSGPPSLLDCCVLIGGAVAIAARRRSFEWPSLTGPFVTCEIF
jgi:hypothetical protein